MSTNRPLRVSIVGAGLGGLAAAIALRAKGFEVNVFGQSSELGEIGAGVQLGPNAMKVLMALGLKQAVLKTGFEPERHVVRNWKTGRVVAATQMKGVYKDRKFNGTFESISGPGRRSQSKISCRRPLKNGQNRDAVTSRPMTSDGGSSCFGT